MKTIKSHDILDTFIEENDISVVTFINEACNVCLSIYPDLEDLEQTFERVAFAMVNTTDDPTYTGSHNIFVYPAIIVYVQGKESKRFERVFSFDDIKNTIARYDSLLND